MLGLEEIGMLPSTCGKLFKNIYIDGALKKIIKHLLAMKLFNENLFR